MKKSTGVLLVSLLLVGAALGWFFWERGAQARQRSSLQGKICAVQYVSHPLLDEVYAGFKEGLEEQGVSEEAVQFSNAEGDPTTAALLADKVCTDDCDVIFVLATPMAQSVQNVCGKGQPIVFGAITDPVSAELVGSMEEPGENLTGSSDQWPYRLQVELMREIWGDGATVGVPFNPGEANTVYAMEQVRRLAQSNGLRLREVPINSVAEAAQAVDALAGVVDVIYIPADNTAVAAAPGIIAAADRRSLPVFAGDPGTFGAGAVVGLGVDYAQLGIANARQVAAIISGAKPAQMPVVVSDKPELYINSERATRFGLDPSQIREQAEQLIATGSSSPEIQK